MTTYRCISADPPWMERGGGKCKRGADNHYDLLHWPDIVRVMVSSPSWRPDPEGCHLWLWATNNYLEDALRVMHALGFRYVTNAVWLKVTQMGLPRMGLGQYLRGQHEPLLFGVKGRLAAQVRNQGTAIVAPRTQHSSKPAAAYERMEAISPGPRLEMFARSPREGWDTWGNEAP